MGECSLSAGQIRGELETLYASVPATRCASSGECCQLTAQEYDDRYATMFPLFRVEYVQVLDFVSNCLSAPRRDYLLAFVEERPRRCPFLGEDNRCTIYAVRPLICRTYAVMHPSTIAATVARNRGRVPVNWLRHFQRRESAMVCPRARVTEPEKLERYADRLLSGAYDRALLRLSRMTPVVEADQAQAFSEITGQARLPLRWSWGGFNAVRLSSPEDLRAEFRAYWERVVLPDAG